MTSKSFWRAAIERAVKSGAQAIILVVGAAQFDWLHADWKSLGLSAVAAFGLSVLTSLASIPYGTDGTPSLVGMMAATKPVEQSLAFDSVDSNTAIIAPDWEPK